MLEAGRHPPGAARRAAGRGDLRHRLQRHRQRLGARHGDQHSQSIQLNPAGGLSESEVQRLVAEADRNSQADLERREIRQLKNRLEGLIYSNERVFNQFRDVLQDTDVKRTQESLMRARQAINNERRADLEAAIYDLNTISRRYSGVMLTRATGLGADIDFGSLGS